MISEIAVKVRRILPEIELLVVWRDGQGIYHFETCGLGAFL